MKIMVLACSFVAMTGVADAATYAFRFESEPMKATDACVAFWSGDPEACENWAGGRMAVELLFSLPDLLSRTIDFMAYWDGEYVGTGTYVRSANYPFRFSGYDLSFSRDDLGGRWELPRIQEYGTITTDANGNLASIRWDALSDTPDVYAGMVSGGWGSCCSTWFEGAGTWTVSEVPLPGGGMLMLTAAAMLGLARLRRA